MLICIAIIVILNAAATGGLVYLWRSGRLRGEKGEPGLPGAPGQFTYTDAHGRPGGPGMALFQILKLHPDTGLWVPEGGWVREGSPAWDAVYGKPGIALRRDGSDAIIMGAQ